MKTTIEYLKQELIPSKKDTLFFVVYTIKISALFFAMLSPFLLIGC